MSYKLSRPGPVFDPALGLLRAEHFEIAYVTNDVGQAKEYFGSRLGIRNFCPLEGEMPSGGFIHIELAWAGAVMYELIEARGPGSELFMSRLPRTAGFHLLHHHLGFLIHDQAQMQAVFAQAGREGFEVIHHSTNPLVEFCFVDVPELGHYLEYLRPTPMGLEFFENVPRN